MNSTYPLYVLPNRYFESAEMYVQAENPFIDVTLKFIRLDDKDALRRLLQKKFEALSNHVSSVLFGVVCG